MIKQSKLQEIKKHTEVRKNTFNLTIQDVNFQGMSSLLSYEHHKNGQR